MEKICLDLEILIEFLRGDPLTIEKIKHYSDREEICITPQTLLYILLSVRKQGAIMPFLNSISVLSFDRKAASLAVKIIEENKEKGRVMGMDEIMTAAICISNGAFLCTKNRKDFEQIKNLKLV